MQRELMITIEMSDDPNPKRLETYVEIVHYLAKEILAKDHPELEIGEIDACMDKREPIVDQLTDNAIDEIFEDSDD